MLGRRRGSKFRRIDLHDVVSWIGLAVGLLGLSAALLGLAKVMHDRSAVVALELGAAVLALLGAAILFAHFLQGWRPFRERIEKLLEYEYQQRIGDRHQLKDVASSGRRAIGSAHPDADLLSRRLSENPEVLRVCVRVRPNGRRKFCGYVLLYPLTPDTAAAIMAESIRAEAEFGPKPLTATFAEARFLYIGMILGTNRHTSPHVKDKLRDELVELLAPGRVERVFARPGSPRGLELMEEHGFRPIGDEAGVWSVPAGALRGQLHLERAPHGKIDLDDDGESRPTAGKQGPGRDRDPAEQGLLAPSLRRWRQALE